MRAGALLTIGGRALTIHKAAHYVWLA